MDRAHAFLAEITDANPNVMFELGAAFADRRDRPVVLLYREGDDTTQRELPIDLRGLVYAKYPSTRGKALEESLHEGMRRNSGLRALLDDQSRKRYLSPSELK